MSQIMMLEGLEAPATEHVERAWYKINALRGLVYRQKNAKDAYRTLMLARDLISGAHAHLASLRAEDFKMHPRATDLVDQYNEENRLFGEAVLEFEQTYLR